MLRRAKKAKSSSDAGRLLLTAEDAESAILVERILARAGHEVTRTTLSSDLLGELTSTVEPYDAVFIDTGSSSSADGLKLLDQIRSLDNGDIAGIPVIILSGTERARLFSWQSGVDGFLVRPVHADEICAEVTRVLACDESERTRYREAELERLSP